MIKIESRVLGMVATNCYLIVNTDNGESIIVDPADSPQAIYDMVVRSSSKPQAVLLTHGHFDHIGAAEAVKDTYGIKIYASEKEKELLVSQSMNLSEAYGMNLSIRADEWLKDGDELDLAGIRINVLHTPGHTAGGVCYYIRDAHILISGDTLFSGSVGRTDFPTSSSSDLLASLHDKLCMLPDETVVYPGHGESTTIGDEKRYNPFM